MVHPFEWDQGVLCKVSFSWFVLFSEEYIVKFPSQGASFSVRSTLQSFRLMVRPFQWGVQCKVSLSKEYIAKFPSHGSSFSLRSTLQSFPFKGVHSKVSLSWLSFSVRSTLQRFPLMVVFSLRTRHGSHPSSEETKLRGRDCLQFRHQRLRVP